MSNRMKFVVSRSKSEWVRVVVHRHWLDQVEFRVRRVWFFWREFTITGPEDSLRAITRELDGYVRTGYELDGHAILL